MVYAAMVNQDEIGVKVDCLTDRVELIEKSVETKMDEKVAELTRNQEDVE